MTDSEGDDNLSELLEDLEQSAKKPAKQRVMKISQLVDKFISISYENGLPNVAVNRLVDVITLPNELDQSSLGNLIRNLYPASEVTDGIVYKIVGSLGHGRLKPSYPTQAALLKWLIMVYDVIANPNAMSQVYNILFNLLDTIAIRHVRPFRIQLLMDLVQQAGNEPALVGLMRVFKDYYPDIIVGNATFGRASVFTHPNIEWRQRLREIQETYSQKTQFGLPLEHQPFRASRRNGKSKIANHTSIIPEVHTSFAHASSITLEEIGDVYGLVENLEKIEYPNQLVAAIADPLLQRFLHLKSSEASSKRINNWLIAFFEDELENLNPDAQKFMDMLQAILDYTRYTKSLPSSCAAYLESMIISWDGIQGRESILGLLAYTPLGSFSDQYQSIFNKLEEAMLDDGSTESKVSLLEFYNSLLNQWVSALLSKPDQAPGQAAFITGLIEHGNTLSLTIIQICKQVQVISTVLAFYESAALVTTHTSLRTYLRIVLPPREAIYGLSFTCSLSTLSRVCAILAVYKRAFEIVLAPQQTTGTSHSPTYSKEYVICFNGYLMDLCNCLWRSRAFNNLDMNAAGCLISPPVVQSLRNHISQVNGSPALPSLFGFSFSPVLCLHAATYFMGEEEKAAALDQIGQRHIGPVTQASLKSFEQEGGLKLTWQNYKLGVLNYLENKGAGGVTELIYSTMTHLKTGRKV